MQAISRFGRYPWSLCQGGRPFFHEKVLDAEWEEEYLLGMSEAFVLKATIRLGVNCEPGLHSSGQGKMESVVYQSAGFPQDAHICYTICIKVLALYL